MDKKKKLKFFPIIFRGLKTSSKIHKGIPFMIFIFTLCSGVLPIVGIYLSRIIINLITSGDTKENIIMTIVGLCLIGLGLGICDRIFTNELQSRFLDVRMKEFIKVNDLSLNIDYKYIEDSSFRDRFEVSTRALQGDAMGFQGLLTKTRDVIPLLLTVIILYSCA